MKDYLIEFKYTETYHGNRIESKRLITAEDAEKAWTKLQDDMKEECKKEGYGTYTSFSLVDARIL